MAQKTFSNEQLAKLWRKASETDPKGTRRDVVLGIMGELGIIDTKENYRKVYNNVTQRVKQLTEGNNAVIFPDLAEGKKGARRSGAEIAALQNILTGAVEETAPVDTDPATEGAVA